MSRIHQDTSELNCILVHSKLDDLGLDSDAFRVYAHLARRANKLSRTWPGIDSISERCLMKRHAVIAAIRRLEQKGVIRVRKVLGGLSEYILTPPSEWGAPMFPQALFKDEDEVNADGSTAVTTSDTSVSKGMSTGFKPSRMDNPTKETLTKGPAVSYQSEGPLPFVEPPQDTLIHPQGSLTAMPDNKVQFPKEVGGNQGPIQRKAYAIAQRLESLHWDTCKALFSKHKASSYAEKALADGHTEERIVWAYSKALFRCHQNITDAMDAGKRHHQRVQSPALMVWLACKTLADDQKTPEERWTELAPKLKAKREEKAREDAKVWKEAAGSGSEIKAFFNSDKSTESGSLHTPGQVHPAPSKTDSAAS